MWKNKIKLWCSFCYLFIFIILIFLLFFFINFFLIFNFLLYFLFKNFRTGCARMENVTLAGCACNHSVQTSNDV